MPRTLALVATPALAAALAVAATGQVQYTLQPLELAPGAIATVATGMNDLGQVVGWATFSGGAPTFQPWLWTPDAGLTMLAVPPGLDIACAVDINEAGVIAGDGGSFSGQAWRLEDGMYTLLGVLPNGSFSQAGAINASGTIAGTSRNFSIAIPPDAFVGAPGEPLALVADGAIGTFLNDGGQVVGYLDSNEAWRFTPGVGVELLGPLGAKTYTFAHAINAAGDVVGRATLTNGNGEVPFLFTDEGGMQEIGDFGGDARANDINDAGEVVGNWDIVGGGKPWVWSEAADVTFLADALVTTLDVNVLEAKRINASGQILARVFDNDAATLRPAVLTPIRAAWADLGFALAGSSGEPALDATGTLLPGTPLSLALTNALPNAPAFLALGLEAITVPFKSGVLVPSFSPPSGVLAPLVTGPGGGVTVGGTWPAGVPSGQPLYAQAWIEDPGGPKGLAASNAVQGVVP